MPTSLFNLSDLVTFAEAARIRGISRQAMSRLVAKGRFGVVSVGGRGFLNRKEIENYVPLKAGRPVGSGPSGKSYGQEKIPSVFSKVAEQAPRKYGPIRKRKPLRK
jgi:hypothetical protein